MTAIQHVAIAVIPPGLQAPVGQMRKRPLRLARKELRETLIGTRAVAWAIFAFDFSLNDYSGKGGGLVWQPHFHGIAAVTDADKVEAALKAQYSRTVEAYKPVWVDKYDLSALGASYAFKNWFPRRGSYLDSGNPTRNPFWNTKPFKLRARPQIDLALLLDFLGFDRRVLFINMDPISIRFRQSLPKPKRGGPPTAPKQMS